MRTEQIKDVLTRAAFEMNTACLPPFLVLDDVDFNQLPFLSASSSVLYFLLSMPMEW